MRARSFSLCIGRGRRKAGSVAGLECGLALGVMAPGSSSAVRIGEGEVAVQEVVRGSAGASLRSVARGSGREELGKRDAGPEGFLT